MSQVDQRFEQAAEALRAAQQVEMRVAKPRDIAAAYRLRRDDDPHELDLDELHNSLERSDQAVAFTREEDLVAVLGLINFNKHYGNGGSGILYRKAICWFITTRHMRKHRRAFHRVTKELWPIIAEPWDEVIGGAPGGGEFHAGFWLKSLGFDVSEDIKTPTGKLVRSFTWRRAPDVS